jgi:hypothetical protein
MTDHDAILLLAAESVDARLDPADAATLDAHLATCPSCRASVAGLVRDHARLRTLEPAPVPERVRATVVAAARSRRRFDARPLAVAAVLLVGGLAAVVAGVGALPRTAAETTASPTAGEPLAFEPLAIYAVPGGVDDLEAGDLDGDGDVDLVVGGGDFADQATVMLGSGTGQFGLGGIVPGGHPRGGTLADLDRDGALDYVATTAGSETVGVFRGDGSGGLDAPQLTVTGLQPREVVVDDFDGNGWPDLAISNASSDTITVVPGTGDGAFGRPRNLPGGDGPWGLAAGDFDADGRIDLAVGTKATFALHVLWGEAGGTFSEPRQVGVPTDPERIAVGDVDRDGDLDLVTTNAGPDTISLFRGDPDGPFFVETILPAPHVGQDGPGPVWIGDLDGDAWPDIVAGFGVHDEVGIWLGDGSGGVSAPIAVPVGDGPTSLVVADVDGDARPDVVTGHANESTVGVLLRR